MNWGVVSAVALFVIFWAVIIRFTLWIRAGMHQYHDPYEDEDLYR